jgi:hypothetical protein
VIGGAAAGAKAGAAAGAKAGAAAFGAYGAAVGAVTGALVGLVKSNASEGKHVSPLRDEFFKMAGGLDKLNEQVFKFSGNLKLVENIFAASTVQEYNKALRELHDLFEFQTAAMNTLDETVKKYNLTVEEMGPAFQRQELDKKAIELFQDYEVLTKAGADHVIVLGKMADAVNQYVQDAVKMGVEVPSAMRPMLDSMVQQGTLTDAAGKKILNLEDAGISFALTMSEGFKSLIDEVKKLTDAISIGLGLAIKNVPDASFDIKGNLKLPKNIPKEFDLDWPVLQMAKGGSGMVKKPTLFLAGEEGPEEFAFSGSGKSFGSGGGFDDSGIVSKIDELIGAMTQRDRKLTHSLTIALKDALAHAA